MPKNALKENSLVAYKARPARVLSVADKLEIELEAGQTKRVRCKDVVLLHSGPLRSLAELEPQTGEVEEAWGLLAGESTNLAELAELVFGRFTPATAWAAWLLVLDGLYFSGTPDELTAQLPEQVTKVQQARATKAANEREWSGFFGRLRAEKVLPEDVSKLSDVEALARGQRDRSRILQRLGRQETPENAHALLLKIGHWNENVNPYPIRLSLTTNPPTVELPNLLEDDRLDLTHLLAFAIDDEGNTDPDDAISLEGDQVWVHVADVAALVKPESAADLEARSRGATLYLPERIVPMVPREAINMLGLGLNDISPALSFKLSVGDLGEINVVKVVPSWVRVTRLSYAEAEKQLSNHPLARLLDLTQAFRDRRRANGATELKLPEVAVRVLEGEVTIRSLPPLKSRTLVTELMLMTGEAVARFAWEHAIPFPFTTQGPPETELKEPRGLAEMFAFRKQLKRSQMKRSPGLHTGLGLEIYAQVTSPLRRYLDLVAHQQLRAFIRGEAVLNAQEVMVRVGAAEAIIGKVRRAERLSNKHWALVYLQHHPQWSGRGIVVERRGSRATVLIPELGLDAIVSVGKQAEPNAEIQLTVEKIDLPTLSAYFRPQN